MTPTMLAQRTTVEVSAQANADVAHKAKGSSTANALFIFVSILIFECRLTQRLAGYVFENTGRERAVRDVRVTIRSCLGRGSDENRGDCVDRGVEAM